MNIPPRTPSISSKSSSEVEKLSLESSSSVKIEDTVELRSKALQKAVFDVLQSRASFSTKSGEIFAIFKESCPKEFKELNDFCAKHSLKIETLLSTKGWKGLKHTMKDGMAKVSSSSLSFEQFRIQAIDHVTQLLLAGIKAMGYDPPGSHSATGTPGWNSDVDTVFIAPPEMPEEIISAEKVLFDLLFFENFGELPGVILDTESYAEHPADTLKTEEVLMELKAQLKEKTTARPHTEEFLQELLTMGETGFARVELNAAALQMMNQCGGIDNHDWEEFKATHIRTAATPGLKKAFTEVFNDVEQFQKGMKKEIEDQLLKDQGLKVPTDKDKRDQLLKHIYDSKPKALKLATMAYKSAVICKLGREIDSWKEKIVDIDKKIIDLNQRYIEYSNKIKGEPDAEQLLNVYRQSYLASLRTLEKNRIKAPLHLATLGLLRDNLFDEGYNTQGAFSKVCSRLGGQMHQRKVEESQAMRRKGLAEGDMVAFTAGFKLPPAQKKVSTIQENATSALENLAMYKGHFHHSLHKKTLEDYQTSLVSQSKYSERALAAAALIVDKIPIPPPGTADAEKIGGLRTEVNNKYALVLELEKLKRGNYLPYAASKEFFKDALAEVYEDIELQSKNKNAEIRNKAIQNKAILDEGIEKILQLSEPGGPLYSKILDSSLLPENHYLSLLQAVMQLMEKINYTNLKVSSTLQDGFAVTGNLYLNNVLFARCGLGQKYAGVKKLHSDAHGIVMRHFGLTSTEAISAFNSSLDRLVMQTYNTAVTQGLLPCPDDGKDSSISLQAAWQKLSTE